MEHRNLVVIQLEENITGNFSSCGAEDFIQYVVNIVKCALLFSVCANVNKQEIWLCSVRMHKRYEAKYGYLPWGCDHIDHKQYRPQQEDIGHNRKPYRPHGKSISATDHIGHTISATKHMVSLLHLIISLLHVYVMVSFILCFVTVSLSFYRLSCHLT